jgi:hypothetical protein
MKGDATSLYKTSITASVLYVGSASFAIESPQTVNMHFLGLIVAFAPAALAQSAIWGQCKYMTKMTYGTVTNRSLRWWSGLAGRHYLSIWLEV